MKQFIENERKIYKDRPDRTIKHIDAILQDQEFMDYMDGLIEANYISRDHLWIVFTSYMELLRFDDIEVEEKNYKFFRRQRQKELEKIRPFIDMENIESPITLIFPKSPREIEKWLHLTFRELGYGKDKIKSIIGAIPFNIYRCTSIEKKPKTDKNTTSFIDVRRTV